MIFKWVIYLQNAKHVHFKWFSGKQLGSLAYLGTLCMDVEEFDALTKAMRFSPVFEAMGNTLIIVKEEVVYDNEEKI